MLKTDRLAKYLESIIVASTLALLAYVPIMAMRIYLADSEIWSVNLGYHLLEDFKHHWVFSRAIFYSWLYIFTGPFEDSVLIFYSARLAMVVNVFVQVYLVHKILRSEVQSRIWQWLGVYLLVSNSFFLTQSFRIRSDLMATTFVLLTIFLLLSPSKHQFKILVLGSLSALICTPKALFVLPVVGIVYLSKSESSKRWWKVILSFFAGVLIYFAALYLRLGPLSDLALSLNNYILSSFHGPNQQNDYFSLVSFTYVTKMMAENKVFVALAIAALLAALKKAFWSDSKNKIWLGILIYMIILIILVPEKVPFLIYSFVPFIVIAIAVIISKPISKRNNKQFIISVIALWIVSSFYISVVRMLEAAKDDANTNQISAINAVQDYLNKYPDITYYDVIGIIPRHSKLRHFAGPHQPEINSVVSDIIMKEKPDLILRVAKFWFFDIDMTNFLIENYIDIGNGFFLKAFHGPKEIKGKEVEFLSHKEKLAFLSPQFENYKGSDLIFRTRDVNKNSRLYLGTVEYEKEKKENVEIVQITPFPYPEKMPGRKLEELFRFDTQF